MGCDVNFLVRFYKLLMNQNLFKYKYCLFQDTSQIEDLCLFAGGATDRVEGQTRTPTIPLTILVQASQYLWPVHAHDFYQQFKYVTHTILLSSLQLDAVRNEILSRFSLSTHGLRVTLSPRVSNIPVPRKHAGVRNCRRYSRLS